MSLTAKHVFAAGMLSLVAAMMPFSIQGWKHLHDADTERMLDVSVSIRTSSDVETDRVGDSVWEPGQGSGFLVSSAGCEVWTNHHVIEGAAFIEVFPRGAAGREVGIPARVVAATPRADFAILRMDSCDGMPEATLGDSNTVQVGDAAYAVGNPLGLNPDTMTQGIISHVKRYIAGATGYLQTDAAINPGNSGGALFNAKGEVIGVSTAIASLKGANSGIGYAVPVNLLKEQARRLRSEEPSFGDAGINDLVADLSERQSRIMRVPDGLSAVMLVKAPDEGPAVGKLEAHDVIFRIGGVNVRDAAHVKGIITDHDAGEAVSFEIIRRGEPAIVQVTLDEGRLEPPAHDPEHYEGLLGMTLEMWTDHSDDRGRFKTPVITQVQSLGPAHKARIMSSQKTLIIGDGTIRPHLLDVKTVTGVVVDGIFSPVTEISQIEQAAQDAYVRDEPLLLEVALWARSNPMDRNAELEYSETRYFTLEPSASAAVIPGDDEVPAEEALPMASVDSSIIERVGLTPARDESD